MKILLILTILLSGCSLPTLNNLSKDYKAKENDSFIILGINPTYRIGVQAGKIDGELWKRNPSPLALNIFPEQGYIVAKLASLEEKGAYAVVQVLPKGIGGLESYTACEKDKILTFNPTQGKIVYFGDISITKADKKVSFEFSQNFDKAKDFIKKEYPFLSNSLTEGKTKLLSFSHKCIPTNLVITIPSF